MKHWPNRLKELQVNLGKTPDEVSNMLGITKRTLAEYTRPGGKPPGLAVQQIVEMLEEQLNSGRGVPVESSKPKLNLVIIHSDYSANVDDVIRKIDELNGKVDPDSQQSSKGNASLESQSGNNEFHYIFVRAGDKDESSKAVYLYNHKRVQPHFFMGAAGLPSGDDARDCYFATTATWLARKALSEGLGHITLVADTRKFWPIAKELKALIDDVKVSFLIQDLANQPKYEEIQALKELGIDLFGPESGRHQGRVIRLHDGYGWLEYVKQESGRWGSTGGTDFFSYNHMRKQKNTGLPITPIQDLRIGDIVSFSMGMNNKGRCAADVVLLEKSPVQSQNPDAEVMELLKEAIKDWANENGWALLSAIGNHVRVLNPDFVTMLGGLGFKNLVNFFAAHPDEFECSHDGTGTGHDALCVRLRK